ncbi:PQQ-binding-like beta-propeller repeat protein [Streptomyces sp. BR123]|uniref:outer membrane protein assembly factor BamB family protein n=1 Tax=Streptomyces sp. BR123 TaxID=2749828 RepID=UPI0015C47D28|nr:PQQ-binding-like beta-propeller repeat protein [Streptomyces sp. BR123]NXY96378.1 PQQ-binding-like beta-propeller repeat protein [Streptomyces sp. BR123]
MTGRGHDEPPQPEVPPSAPGFGPAPEPYASVPATPVPAGGRRLRGESAVVAGALAAVVLAVAGFAYVAWGRDGGGGAGPAAAGSGTPASPPMSASASVDKGDGKGTGNGPDTVDPNAGIKPGEVPVWLRENRNEVAGAGARQFGPWRVGDVVVRAMDKEVTAYAVADGQEKWKVALQTPLCAAPQAPAAGGKLVLGVRESDSATAKCTALQQVDLTAGKAGWKVPVPQENRFDTTNEFQLAVSGDTVAVARSAVMSAFSAADGRKLFGTSKPNGCYPVAFGGGARLIAVRTCPDPEDPSGPGLAMVEEMDPATGAARWSHRYGKGWNVGRILSSDPLVVAAYDGGRKAWSLTAFTADGKVRSHGEPPFGVDQRCNGWGDGSGRLHECNAAVADADTLYIARGKVDKSLATELTDEVVAVDLGTGKEKWHTKAPRNRRIWPLAIEDGKVLAYVAPGEGEAGAVAALAPADGALTVVLQSPAGAAGAQGVFHSHNVQAAWAGGRLFLLNGTVKSPEKGNVTHALLSFGRTRGRPGTPTSCGRRPSRRACRP